MVLSFKKTGRKMFVMISLLLLFTASYAQDLMDSLARDEKKVVDAIAPYPQEVRQAILEAAEYPQVLVKLENIQSRSSQAFQDLIRNYPRNTQEEFYALSRYPTLLNQLASDGKKKTGDIQPLVGSYPPDFQHSVTDLYRRHFNELVTMNSLFQSSQNTLQAVIKPYPAEARDALQKVVNMPEVINLLTDNIDLAISLGESFRADPTGVQQELDSLNRNLASQSEKDLAEFKGKVEGDTELQQEMKQASDEFAQNDRSEPAGSPTIVNNYYDNNPYPYWFGYPYWAPAPAWYPRPVYYDTGFYLGPGGNIVVVGLPSAAYSNWFFSLGYRHYPHLYHQYNTYYNVHRTNITNVNLYREFNTAVNHHFANRAPNQTVDNATGRQPAVPRSSDERPGMNGPSPVTLMKAGKDAQSLPTGMANPRVGGTSTDVNTRTDAKTGPTETPKPLDTPPRVQTNANREMQMPAAHNFGTSQDRNFNPDGFHSFHANNFHAQSWHSVAPRRGR